MTKQRSFSSLKRWMRSKVRGVSASKPTTKEATTCMPQSWKARTVWA